MESVQYLGVEQLNKIRCEKKTHHKSGKATHPGELLNLFDVVLNELRVVVLKVPVKLCTTMPSWVLVKPDIAGEKHTRNVVYLYTIPDPCLCIKTELTCECVVCVSMVRTYMRRPAGT